MHKGSPSLSKQSEISKHWKGISDLFEEAHLPHMGLPARWEKTEKEHILKAYNPETKTEHDIITGKEKRLKREPIGFIKSTPSKNPVGETKAPAAAEYERFIDSRFQKNIVHDPDGKTLVPCLVDGDYVDLQSLALDHLMPKARIRERQESLVTKLNVEPDGEFTKAVMELPGINKFFVKAQMQEDKKPKYYGTVFFYELYFNDIDNLWLICQACNLKKSDQNTEEWLRAQWMYGDDFLDYIASQKEDSPILKKLQDKQGLATVAIEWFWNKHGTYIANNKKLFQDVVVPIKILNRNIEHLLGSGKIKEADRKEKELQVRLGAMKTLAQEDINLGNQDRKNIPLEAYEKAGAEAMEETLPVMENVARQKLNAEATAEKKEGIPKNQENNLNKKREREEGSSQEGEKDAKRLKM